MHRNRRRTIGVVIAAIALVGWLVTGCGGGGGVTPADTGSVSGTVVLLDNGTPLVDVTVTVDGRQGVSDNDGNFTVTGVPPGPWEVVATSSFWDQVGDPPEVVVIAGQTTALSAPILMTGYGPPPPPEP